MTEYQLPVRSSQKSGSGHEIPHIPYWAQSHSQHAQDLLECSDEPIEYDHDDSDYWDNSFFFPEDCSWSPPRRWAIHDQKYEEDTASEDDTMIPGLPDIKMLDAEALSDLLEDNLSPPEITSILVFATNGAIFAYASSLPSRQLRNLSATYGAAYTCYAKNASSGNLTGVNPSSHPSSYVTARSLSLGDVGSIVFELDESVAVVTRIADKVLLAAVGPSKLDHVEPENNPLLQNGSATSAVEPTPNGHRATTNGTPSNTITPGEINVRDTRLEAQCEIDRSSDLARLASLNLSASPAILLALESKSAALGKFLGQKLHDLESPEDF